MMAPSANPSDGATTATALPVGSSTVRYRQEPEDGRALHQCGSRPHDAGVLSEEDVEGIRAGAIADPTVGQVAALAGVFGVEPSYLLDRGEPVLDTEFVEALRDGMVREAVREISRLPDRDKPPIRRTEA
jgi:hypothetical protein